MNTPDPDDNDGSGYFLYHSIGHYPDKVADMRRAAADYAEVWGRYDDSQWPNILGLRQRFIDGWRTLINAPQGTLTTAENVTAALHALVSALPADQLKGKRVLVAADCFPSLHFLLVGMADRYGFAVDTVPLRQGATWVEDEDMIAAWGDDVGLALVTWVTSTSSHRCDLDALVAHGRQKGSVIGVDVTQGIGLLPFDVMNPAIDFTVSTSLKWLCCTTGAGILHVAEPLFQICAPELRGWFSQPDPFSWDLDKFAYAPDIRRFDHGTPSVLGAVLSLPALEWNLAQDRDAMIAHNRNLSSQLFDLADELCLPVVTPRRADKRGGSVMIQCTNAQAATQIVERLRLERVTTDARGAVLRLSPGVCTTQAGVAKVAETLRHHAGHTS